MCKKLVYIVGVWEDIFVYWSFSIYSDVILIHNVPFDWITFIVGIWNFGVMGLIVIHWKGPLRLQQAYLILTSAIVVCMSVKLVCYTTGLLTLHARGLFVYNTPVCACVHT